MQSDIESAQLAYDFAQLDLKKYIEGEYPNSLTAAESNITVAEAEVAQAKDTLDWSKKLYEEQYLSESELEKDTLSYTRKQLAVELKNEAKDLLVNYTYKRQLAKLQSDVTQARSALERTAPKGQGKCRPGRGQERLQCRQNTNVNWQSFRSIKTNSTRPRFMHRRMGP